MNNLIAKLAAHTMKLKADARNAGSVSGAPVRGESLSYKLLVLFENIASLLRQVSFKGFVVTCMLLLIIVLSAVGVVYSSHLSRQLFAEQAILLEKNDQLQLEWAQLLLEQSAWSSPNRIEDVSRNELGMKIPETEDIQLIY